MSKHGRPGPKTEAPDDSVKLKPIAGIRPGVYLTVLYGIAIALILFFLLFYPGIRNRGSYLAVSGDPLRASVLVDGVYQGTTPCTIFVKKGQHDVQVTRPFFTPLTTQVTQPGRIFATLIVPQRRSLGYQLDLVDVAGLLSRALLDFVHNPTASQAITYALQDSSRAMAADSTGSVRSAVSDFVVNVMYFVTNEAQLRSVIGAAASAWSFGGPLTLESLLGSVSKMTQLAVTHENLPIWLLLSIDQNSDKPTFQSVLGSAWVKGYTSRMVSTVANLAQQTVAFPGGPGVGALATVGGLAFRAVPAGTLLMGKDNLGSQTGAVVDQSMPHPVKVDRFYLDATEVTNAQYAAFCDAVPQWRASNRAELVSRGLASDGYLADWASDRYPAGTASLPVTGVSWYAASAYCQWLSGVSGATVRLPTESQFEWAARGGLRGKPYPTGDNPGSSVFFASGITGPAPVGSSGVNGYGLSDMAGNVWEWCLDPYAPDAYLLASLDAASSQALEARLPPSDEKVVRGGSWANQKDSARVYTRAAQPADWCSPYLGFRPALIAP